MQSTQKLDYRSPLGSKKDIDKIISSLPQQQTLQQTRKLNIIFAKKKIQVDIPIHWTVNKIKCMMSTQFKMFYFDKCQFQCNKLLIPGKTIVANLPEGDLIVTQADCPDSFHKYYKSNMTKILKKYQINTTSSLYPITHQSLAHCMSINVPKERHNNLQQIPVQRNRERGNEQQQGMMVINIFRVIGIAIMSNLIFSFASYFQIGILIGIALLYYLIDEHVKQNDRRRRQQERLIQRQQQANRRIQELNRQREQRNRNKNQLDEKMKQISDIIQKARRQAKIKSQNAEQKPQSKIDSENNFISHLNEQNQREKTEQKLDNTSQLPINQSKVQQIQKDIQVQKQVKRSRYILKAKSKLWMAFIFEAFYCYVLSIFPNWTVQTHLHANQQKMDKVMDEVKQLDPEASEQIKKWEIKQRNTQQILKQEELKQKVE